MGDEAFNQTIEKLTNSDKFIRRKGLQELATIIRADSAGVKIDIINQLASVATNDPVGTLRENATLILQDIVTKSSNDLILDQVPIVLELVTKQAGTDPVEEARLALLRLLRSCVEKPIDHLKNLDSLTATLKAALQDSFGEAVRQACETIIVLADANPHFGLQSDYFVAPLLKNLTHRQLKVRIDCIRALQPVLIGSSLRIPEASPVLDHLQARDSNPLVQLALVKCVGTVCDQIGFRHQYFHLLLPVLLVASSSEFEQISQEGQSRWKQLVDASDIPIVKNYCKELLDQIASSSEDWTVEIRVRSARLLQAVIGQMKGDASEHLGKIMELLRHQSGDQEDSVTSWVTKSAVLIGQHCGRGAAEWLASEGTTGVDLSLVANILQGSEGSEMDTMSLLTLLEQAENSSKQCHLLLDCLSHTLRLGIAPEGLDRFLILVLSSGQESIQNPKLASLLQQTADKFGHPDAASMIRHHLESLWKLLPSEEVDSGDTASRPWRILEYAVHRIEAVDSRIIGLIHRFLQSNPSAEIKLKCLNMLTASVPKLVDCQLDREGIVGQVMNLLKWKSGRTAATIRSAATLCTWSMIQHRQLTIDSPSLDNYLKLVMPLVEDEVILTRITACRILEMCLSSSESAGRNMDDVFKVLSGRLDDVSREVRREAIHCMCHIFRVGCRSAEYESRLRQLLKTMANDDDPSTSQTAQSFLDQIGGAKVEEQLSQLQIQTSFVE